jgi:hypothetical protein
MTFLARFFRSLAKVNFRLRGLATIKDISTEKLREMTDLLTRAGWRKVSEYKGVDAWVDYGCITMRKAGVKLKLEWDNWTEGSVEGPRRIVEEIGREHGFAVSHDWRWSEYDESHPAR